jgi:hypothetical protein
MYVTAIYQGRPVQCYVPKAGFPEIDRTFAARFEALEDLLGSTGDPVAHAAAVAATVQRYDLAPDAAGDRRSGVLAAIRHAAGLGRLDAAALKRLNALLGGSAGPGSFRSGPAWIAAEHPAMSTHVGSPASRLGSLVSDVLSLQTRHGNALVRVLVAMVRLLQIHPFHDANGRTARLHACWAARAAFGPSPLFPQALARLWMGGSVGINQMCISVRDDDDWEPLFDGFLAAADQSVLAAAIQDERGVS